MWSIIATWTFSLQAVREGARILSSGGTALDAAEAGIRLVESDPGVDCVGRGGFLNRDGVLELDAAVMDGNTMRTGAVAGLRGFENPVSVARAVMERTRHSILVGRGAEEFARAEGFPACDPSELVTKSAYDLWMKKKTEGHDTIGVVALDAGGGTAAATSTSGACMKLPGRVGDSPVIGSGFYAESGVGGAAATGWGEDIMRTCCSFRAVDLMRAGLSPREAAERTVIMACETIRRHGHRPAEIALVCMNADGEFGAAADHEGFAYACASDEREPVIVTVEPVVRIGKE